MTAPHIQPFGNTADGQPVHQITLTDGAGNTASLLSYGAVLQKLLIRKPDGETVDVCLGYDTLAEYEATNSCFGSTMGRCTGRIAQSRFTLSGKEYRLSENRKGFHIHGGFQGFHKKVWEFALVDDGVRFTYHSPDGEEGYPGNLTASVTYHWTEAGVLALDYDCVSDRETVINLTNHSYFNLDGHASGSAMGHRLQIFSDTVAETTASNVPTGRVYPVAGTPLDFTQPQTIGSRIAQEDASLLACGGYDHNYPLPGSGLAVAAKLWGEHSGIVMTVRTDLPDLGLYTANFLAEQPGKDGAQYGPRHGVCLETQYMPNGVNLEAFSPKPVFQAGQPFRHRTEFCFSFEA